MRPIFKDFDPKSYGLVHIIANSTDGIKVDNDEERGKGWLEMGAVIGFTFGLLDMFVNTLFNMQH